MLITDRSLQASAALKNLPSFPYVLAKVVDLLADDASSIRTIADTLKTDAALSAEVLRLVNSPVMSLRCNVTNVVQALALLGARRVTALLMTLGLSKFVARAGKSEAMRRLWRHNLACALAARHLAASDGDPSEAYYAGLFHDVGRLALLVQEPAFYDQALRNDGSIDELERSHFGVDHCEAGAWVIEKWKLPKAFVEVALCHHRPKPNATKLTVLVHNACDIADSLGFGLVPVNSGTNEFGPADELGFSIALAINAWECEYEL